MMNDILTKYSGLYGQLNSETQIHSINVGKLCEASAPYLSLDPELCLKLGFLHDVGKIYIPSRILRKNTSLTTLEREIVDLHAYYGYRLLKEIGEPKEVYLPILFHHGYIKPRLEEPTETLTSEIVRYIELVHAADIYDAMSKTRVYHEPFNKNEILDELRQDPICNKEVVDALGKVGAFPVRKTDVDINNPTLTDRELFFKEEELYAESIIDSGETE